MKIVTKMTAGYLVIALLGCLLAAYGYHATQLLLQNFAGVEARTRETVLTTAELRSYALRAQGHLLLFLAVNDPLDREKYQQRTASLLKCAATLALSVQNDYGRNIMAGINDNIKKFIELTASLLHSYDEETVKNGKFDMLTHQKQVDECNQTVVQLCDLVGKIEDYETNFLNRQELMSLGSKLTGFSKLAEADVLLYVIFHDSKYRDNYVININKLTAIRDELARRKIESTDSVIFKRISDNIKDIALISASLMEESADDRNNMMARSIDQYVDLAKKLDIASRNLREAGMQLAEQVITVEIEKRINLTDFAKKLQTNIIWVTLFIFILSVSIGLLISTAVTRPLHRLRTAMTAVSRGQWGTLVNIKANDEVGELSKAFNWMTGQLKQTYCALAQEKEALEQKEQTVRESRQYLSTFLDAIPDLAWLVDRQGRYLAVNEAFRNVFNLQEENIIGRISYQLWPPQLADRFQAEDQAVMQSGQPRIIPELVTINGQTSWFETIKTPIANDQGEPIGIAGISRDISFYKQTEELLEHQVKERTAELAWANADLRLNEARLEALLAMNQMAEASGSQLAGFALENVVTLTKSRYGILLFFNIVGKVERQYIWPPELADKIEPLASWATAIWEKGAPLQELIICNEPPRLPPSSKPLTEVMEINRYLALAITENDRLVAAAVVFNKDELYDGADARQLPLLMTGMWNIRQRRRIRQRLFHSEKLASLGLLISGVAHEINNPNSFIFFNLPILRDYLHIMAPIVDEYAAGHPEFSPFSMPYAEFRRDLFQLLENMEHGSNRINTTVSLLKEFARQPGNAAKQWVNPKVVLEQGFNLCKTQLSKMVKHLELDLPANLPDMLIYPQYVEQILVNLLINAGQSADKPEAWVRLKAGLTGEKQNFLTIEVSDNGCGIPPEHQEKIYDPFFTTKPVNQGTGLGLSICHRLVEELGGQIEVESEASQGSTFRVILPVTPPGSSDTHSR